MKLLAKLRILFDREWREALIAAKEIRQYTDQATDWRINRLATAIYKARKDKPRNRQ